MNTMAYVRQFALVAGLTLVSAVASAIPVSGGLGLAGTSMVVSQGIDFSNVGVTPDGILDTNFSSTFVLIAEGDLASLELSDDVLITDLAFDLSLPTAGLWLTNGNGFSFRIDSLFGSDIGNPAYQDFSGTGYISLAGFDDTFATWHYSNINGKTYTLSILPESITVPEPSSISLLLSAGMLLLVRRLKR